VSLAREAVGWGQRGQDTVNKGIHPRDQPRQFPAQRGALLHEGLEGWAMEMIVWLCRRLCPPVIDMPRLGEIPEKAIQAVEMHFLIA
jgi:hypothetical protein